jgi:hypothetical protein
MTFVTRLSQFSGSAWLAEVWWWDTAGREVVLVDRGQVR